MTSLETSSENRILDIPLECLDDDECYSEFEPILNWPLKPEYQAILKSTPHNRLGNNLIFSSVANAIAFKLAYL